MRTSLCSRILPVVGLGVSAALVGCAATTAETPTAERSASWFDIDSSYAMGYGNTEGNVTATGQPAASSDTRLATRDEPRSNTNATHTSTTNNTYNGWPTQHTSDSQTWNGMAFPTGDARTSVLGIEKGYPHEVRAGQNFDYQIIVTNLTSNAVDDVVVTEQVNKNFKLVKSVPETQSNSGGVMSWALGDFKPGESKVIRVTGSPTGEEALNSCSAVTYSSALCSNVPVVAPKLRLTKTAPADITRCDDITYNFEVTNSGSGTINNVKITDKLPEGLKSADGRNTIEIAAGNLAAGQSRQFTAKVHADKAGRYENQANASAEGMSADSSMVTVVVHQPALTIDADCPKSVPVGRDVEFKYTVKSTGDIAAANTTLSVNLPNGTTFVRADNNGTNSNGHVSWNLGALNANDSKTVTVVAHPTAAGNLQSSASVQGACATAATASCTVNVMGAPDIGTAVSDDSGVVAVGDNHVFTYVVKNQGQVDLTNVTVNATLSSGLDYVSGSAQGKASGKSVSWNLGTLKPGQQSTLSITVKGNAAGEQGISTETKCDQLERTARNDEQVTYVSR